MQSPWRCLEQINGFSAVPAEWQQWLGPHFAAFSGSFLRKTKRQAGSYPCPNECGCSHELVPQKDGGFIGVCCCGEDADCDDIRVSLDEATVWELNRSRLGEAIACAFESQPIEQSFSLPNTFQVAAFSTKSLPVILTLPSERDEFQLVVTTLVAQLREAFILIAPTNRFVDSKCKELLTSRNGEFFDLETNVVLTAEGKLQALRPARELFARSLFEDAQKPGASSSLPDAVPLADRILSCGRLRYRPGFEDIWFDDKPYDLRDRKKVRLCIQYLVEQKAFDVDSARHFVKEIDLYVRVKGDYPKSADIKIDHYFNDNNGKLPQLRKELIHAAGRNGRFFLKVN